MKKDDLFTGGFSSAEYKGYRLIQVTLRESTPKIAMCRCPLVCLFASAIALLEPSAVLAQIVPDASLGRERSRLERDVLVNGERGDRIEGGSQRGGNLFHSFETFNVSNGQRVYFAAPGGIDRILARVTGDGRSRINGTLGALGTADLFLINPNGIVFGQNARLDVRGSFVGASAAAIEFGDRGIFSVEAASSPSSLLTIQPTALLLNASAQPIVNESIAIDSSASQIVGLQAAAGRSLLLIGSNVRLNGGVLTAPGGMVELAAAQGTVSLFRQGRNWRMVPPEQVQGDIVLQNRGAIRVSGDDRGSVALYAESIALDGSGIIAGIGEGLGTSASQAGNMTLNAARAIQIQNSVVANVVAAGGRGNAGDIRLRAETISLSDRAQIQTTTRSQGDAGNLYITTGSLSLIDGSGLFATTDDRGNAGNIQIRARDAVTFNRSAASSTVSPGAIGQGGSIEIDAGSLSVTNGSGLLVALFGTGTAGEINVDIDGEIRLDGSDRQGNFSEIGSAIGEDGVGQAGNVRIRANSMSIANGAAVISNTAGQGDAGMIQLWIADRLDVGEPAANGVPSGIFTTVGEGATGNGGTILVTADELSMTRSLLTAASGGEGNAGNIEVTADVVRLDDAIIATTGRSENGGNLTFRGLDILLLDNGGVITAATRLAGVQGNSGNVSIASDLIVAVPAEDSDIAANAEGGRGGNIEITTQGIFGIESRSARSPLTNDINASSRLSVDGTVTIAQPDVVLRAGVVALPAAFSPPPIAQNCQAQGDRSRFVNSGRGGLPINPAAPLVVEELWQDLGEPASGAAIESTPLEETIDRPQSALTEAQGWRVTSEGQVILTATAPTVTPYGIGSIAECQPVL